MSDNEKITETQEQYIETLIEKEFGIRFDVKSALEQYNSIMEMGKSIKTIKLDN